MAKQLKTYKLNDATLAQIEWLSRSRNGNATAVVEIAVDRMYQQERIATMQEIDDRMLSLARAVHGEVCGCDNKHCAVPGEIYDWLEAGDGGEGRTVADLVAEWLEFTSPE
jgi:hypothetical protein